MGKPVTFYLVRHGQTYTNLRELLIGGGGSAPLTPAGRAEAKLLGLALRDVEFEAAYASPLARARETARNILGDRQLEIQAADGLRDISWGRLEGSRPDVLLDVLGRTPYRLDEAFGGLDDADFVPAFGGESLYAFVDRFGAEIDRIGRRHSGTGGRVLAVCHSSLAFFLMRHMEDAPGIVANTSITELVWADGDIRVIRAGDSSSIEQGRRIAAALPPLRITLFGDVDTLFRSKGLLEGRCDSVLTETGLRQAKALAAKWRDSGFTAAYCSPLDRARTLAEAVVPAGMPISTLDGLAELFYAERECESIALLRETCPDMIEALEGGGEALLTLKIASCGEYGAAAAARMLSALHNIAAAHGQTGGHIAVFSHDVAIRSVLAELRLSAPDKAEVKLVFRNEAFLLE